MKRTSGKNHDQVQRGAAVGGFHAGGAAAVVLRPPETPRRIRGCDSNAPVALTVHDIYGTDVADLLLLLLSSCRRPPMSH